MKVKDLIINLLDYNLEADVTLIDSEDISINYVTNEKESSKEYIPINTPQLFIEGVDLIPNCVHEYIEDNDERMCSFYQKPCRLVGECFQYEEFYE